VAALATVPVPLYVARRTSPLSIVYEMVAVLVGVVFLVGTVEPDWFLAFSLASSGLGFVALVFRWWFRTYTVMEERMLLDEGVLRRRNRVVPFARVQQVDVNQELFHRPFGLASLNVETAGEGGSSSVSLRVLRRDDAEALRAYVLERRHELTRAPAGHGQGEGSPDLGERRAAAAVPYVAERALGQMTPNDLVLAGVTHSLVLAAMGAYVVLVTPLLAIAVADEASTSVFAALQTLGILAAGTIIVGSIAAAASMMVSLVSDWNWTLSDHIDDLHVRRGLLEVRSQSLPRRRVQQVTIVDNPVRRKLGVLSVALHTAAMPGSHQATMVQVPLVRRDELDQFLTALMGSTWVLPELQPRSEAARWRALRRRVLLLLVLFGAPVVASPGALWVLLLLVPLAWPWGESAHRRAGLAATDSRVVLASGVLHHRIDIAPRDRLQSTRASSSPLQRRVDLATIHVDLAGTTWRGPLRMSARLFDVDAGLAAELRRDLPRPASGASSG
jgi:putative membrane protein